MLALEVLKDPLGGQSLLEFLKDDRMERRKLAGRRWHPRRRPIAGGALVPFDSSEPVSAEPVGALVSFGRFRPR